MCGTLLRDKLVKRTRKRYRCELCGRMIPKGTMANYYTSVDGRDMFSGYNCLDCQEFMRTKEAKSYAEDDGCLWGDAFFDRPYAAFPILEPVQSVEDV